MTDEAGHDSKILAVPIDKLCTLYRKAQASGDMPEQLLAQIAHFFEHYKDLDEQVGEGGRLGGIEEAKAEILASVQMYKDAPEKPNF